MAEAEALTQFFDLGGQSHRIGRIALEDFDGNGSALAVAEQSVNDLQLPLFSVAGVAQAGERTGVPLEVAARKVVENQRAFMKVACGKSFLDARLAGQEPVHGGVEVVLIGILGQVALLGEGAQTGFRVEGAGGGEFGTREEDAGGNQGHAEIALRARLGAQKTRDAQLAHGGKHGGNVTVRQGAGNAKSRGGGPGGRDLLGFEKTAQALDDAGRPLGKIGDGAVLDLPGVAVGFAKEDAGRGVAVGDALNKHGYLFVSKEQINTILVNNKIGDAIKYTWLHSEDKKGN